MSHAAGSAIRAIWPGLCDETGQSIDEKTKVLAEDPLGLLRASTEEDFRRANVDAGRWDMSPSQGWRGWSQISALRRTRQAIGPGR